MAWTKEKVAALKTPDIRQLRANAAARQNADIVQLCDEVLAQRPRERGVRTKPRQRELDGRPLISRSKAFEMRGAKLRNPRWSWGGVRDSDGIVVFTIWANDIEKDGGVSRYRLYGPDRGGDRPWGDTPGGKERLRHCELAISKGHAEGVVIYGERRGEDLPLEQASRVSGADAHAVLRFDVVVEGDEYWAVWKSSGSLTKA